MSKTTIPTGGITDGTIASGDLADDAVTAAKIADAVSLGKILNVESATISGATNVTSTTLSATAITDSITPSATSSKILVIADCAIGMYENSGSGTFSRVQLYRDINGGGFSAVYRSQANAVTGQGGGFSTAELSMSSQVTQVFLDSPNTTSAVTYKIYTALNVASGSGDSVNTGPSNMDGSMTLIEIAG